jgi:hypothetical protein
MTHAELLEKVQQILPSRFTAAAHPPTDGLVTIEIALDDRKRYTYISLVEMEGKSGDAYIGAAVKDMVDSLRGKAKRDDGED